MKKKIIFSDIDGTIRPTHDVIRPVVADAIRNLDSDKYEFVLVTGRSRPETERFAATFGGCRYIIDANGGELFDTVERKVLHAFPIPQKAIERMDQLAKQYNLRLVLNVAADYALASRVKHKDGRERQIESIEKACQDYLVVGGFLTEVPAELFDKIRQEIYETEGMIVANQGPEDGKFFVDFGSIYANKGIAMKKLLQLLGSDYYDCVAIGNEKNDIAMFSAVGTSIAVANAPQGIQDMVDIVIDSAENDGVAKYLNGLK
ncbi:MAG: HAD family phosphatase [Clostridia bacterium]|nr:HAD family phosphatase [Clostridia bacterium]